MRSVVVNGGENSGVRGSREESQLLIRWEGIRLRGKSQEKTEVADTEGRSFWWEGHPDTTAERDHHSVPGEVPSGTFPCHQALSAFSDSDLIM